MEDGFIARAKSTGKIPKALENKPEIGELTKPFFRAYMDLRGRMKPGDHGIPNPISTTDILLYGSAFQFDPLASFFQIIAFADDRYIHSKLELRGNK